MYDLCLGGCGSSACVNQTWKHEMMFMYSERLSHEIFGPVHWPVLMHLGLNKNSFWFLNLKELHQYAADMLSFYEFRQTFSEILRISEQDWQLRT
jgi:hypothetical protein